MFARIAILMYAFVFVVMASSARAEQQEKQAQDPPKDAEAVLREMSEYLASLKSYSFTFTSQYIMTSDGMRIEYDGEYLVDIERPAKYSMRHKSGWPGVTVVSDGEQRWIYAPEANSYAVGEVPARIDTMKLLGDVGSWSPMSAWIFANPALYFVLGDDPVSATMMFQNAIEYIGVEEFEGKTAHHIRLTEMMMKLDMWVSAHESPVLLGASSETPMDGMTMGGMKNMKSVSSVTFNNWQAFDSLPAERFSFTPPEDAELVDDLAEAVMAAAGFANDFEMISAVDFVGEPAPELELKLLDGGIVSLAKLAEQDKVVVLDFWATWCAPCRLGLPVVTEVVKKFPAEQVAYFSVNIMEDEATIRSFFKETGLSFPVALDMDGAVSDQYASSGIPQTVVIDKDGVVQAVHVGFSPDLGERLEEQLTAVLAGESLVDVPERIGEAEIAGAENLVQAWSLRGDWNGVAVDEEAGGIYALVQKRERQLARLSTQGQIIRSVAIDATKSTLRIANLREDDEPEFLIFGTWSHDVRAFSADGTRLWTYAIGQGIDDVWAADLTGDGLDEVIIGYNGATGLHVLTPAGELLWKYAGIGNVWHVTAGDVTGDGRPEVLTTSASGRVHVFSAEGKLLQNMNAGLYASMVRFAPGRSGQQPAIFVGGSIQGNGEAIVRLSVDGEQLWSAPLPGGEGAYINALSVAPSQPWLAVGMRSGDVLILDITNGSVIAHVEGFGRQPAVAWKALEDDEASSLLVTTGRELKAIRIIVDR